MLHELPDVEFDGAEVRTLLMMWRCVPLGVEALRVLPPASAAPRRTGVCCTSTTALSIQSSTVCKQPLCSMWRLLRDAAASFVLAFFFHLVPSIAWGAERSLGSPSNHALMGIVWFLGWPVWFVIVQALRPWGLRVEGGARRTVFVPFQS